MTTKRKRLWWIAGALFAFLCLCLFVANRDPYGTAQFDFLQGAKLFEERIVRSPVPSHRQNLFVQFTIQTSYDRLLEAAVKELKDEGWKTLAIDHTGASFAKEDQTVYLVRGSVESQGDSVYVNYTRPASWLDKARTWLNRLSAR